MTLGEKIWKVAKYLPIGSFINSSLNYIPSRLEWLGKLRFCAHSMYAVLPIVVVTGWGIMVVDTGKLNPFEHRRILKQRMKENEAYNENWEKIFGKNGYADRDNNGFDMSEVADAYERIGLGETIIGSEYRQRHGFDKFHSLPTPENLEKAVQSYEAEQKEVK